MLNIFTLANGRLVQEEIEALEELSKFQPIWVDLESPTVEEKRWIKQYYGLSPTAGRSGSARARHVLVEPGARPLPDRGTHERGPSE